MNSILVSIFLLLFYVSCSTSKNRVQSEPEFSKLYKSKMSKIEKIDTNATFEKATREFDALIEDAKKAGVGAIEYLAGDLFVKGMDLSMRGNSRLASFILKYVCKLAPDDDYVKKKYAVELIRVGDMKGAEIIFAELFEKSGEKDVTIGLILGGIYTALEMNDSAEKMYQKVLKFDKDNEEACIFLAKSYAIAKKFKTSERLLQKCEKNSKGKGVFSYYRGKILVDRGKKREALNFFKKSLRMEPDYYQAIVAIGLLHEEKGKLMKAAVVYRKFLKKHPDNYVVLSRLIQIMFAEGQFKGIIPYVERLVAIDATDLNLKVRLGILYTDAKRYREAKTVFWELLQEVPDSDKVLYYLGSLHQLTGEAEDAINYFLKIPSSSVLFHDSNIQAAHLLHASAKLDDQNGRQARIDRFKKFIGEKIEKSDGLKVELSIILSGFYEYMNDLESAISVTSSVRGNKEFGPGHEYYLASLHERNKDFVKAREIMEELLEKNPKNADAMNFIGYSLLEKGEDIDKAYKYITQALLLKPNDGFIRDSLGWYYYKIGNLKRALKEIKKAWEIVKTDVIIIEHLAIIYKEMKDYAKAKEFYKEALKNCKIESERESVLKSLRELEEIRMPASRE